MADSKITALTALTAADPANDMIPIVDVSDTPPASGNTKRISINNILACSPSATLASATVTGDLTVDTNVLKVDTTNNVVGIGTATPNDWGAKFVSLRSTTGISYTGVWNDGVNSPRLEIGHTSTGSYLNASSASGGSYSRLRFQVAGADQYQIDTSGVFTWYDGAGGTRMTLNSTGLGVKGSPISPLTVYGAALTSKATALFLTTVGSPDYGWDFAVDSSVNGNLFFRRVVNNVKTDVLEFDRSNGNLGIGVTPTNKLTIGTGTFNASTASGSSSLYSTVANGLVVLADGLYVATRAGVNRLIVDTSGNIISNVTSTAPSLTDNGFMVFNLTSNTNLRISVRGSDGVTRVANITLA